MTRNIYKVVYIIGPRTKHAATWGKFVFSDDNCLDNIQHDHRDILVIGDGINPILKESIDALRDKIANNTLITIIANGSHLLQKHYIHIYNSSSFTATFLQDIQKTNPSTPLNVLIYSSNSGYASSDVAYLVPNSMLITYSRDDLSNEFLSGVKNTVNALLTSECTDILSCYLKKGALYLPERFGASFSLTKTESFIEQTVSTIKYYLGLYPKKDTDYADCEIQFPNNDKNTLNILPTFEKLFQDFESCVRDALHPTNLNSTIAFKDFVAHTQMHKFMKHAVAVNDHELLNTTLQFYSDRTKTGEFSNDEFYTIARQLENLNIPEEYIKSLRDFLVECIISTPTGVPYFFVTDLLHKFKIDIGVFFDPKIPEEILSAAKFEIINNLTPQTVNSLIKHGMKIEEIAQALSYYCDELPIDKFIYLFDHGYTLKKEKGTYNLAWHILETDESIKFFLDAGLDPNTYIGKYGLAPLSYVVSSNHSSALEKVKLLIEHGADPLFGAEKGHSVFQQSGWIFAETFPEDMYPNSKEITKQISKVLLAATPSLRGVSEWTCGMCYIDDENFNLCYVKEANFAECTQNIIEKQYWNSKSLDYKFAFLVEIGFLVSSLYIEHNQRNKVFSEIDYHPVFEGQKRHFGLYDHCYNNTETGYYHLSVVTDVTHIVNDYRSEVLNELGIFDQRIDKCYLGVNEFVDELLISKYATFQDITPLVSLPSC